MQRSIKIGKNRSIGIDDEKTPVMTEKEWIEEGMRRFGKDWMKWRFRCPMCGHVASIEEMQAAGAKDPNCAYQECIGRYTGKGSPKEGDSAGCNWAAYGLFGIPKGGVVVLTGEEEGMHIFEFAEPTVESEG